MQLSRHVNAAWLLFGLRRQSLMPKGVKPFFSDERKPFVAASCSNALTLAVGEIRLPFLGKGRHAFLLVVERKQRVKQPAFEA